MKSALKRISILSLVLVLLLSALPASVSAAGDAMETEEVRRLLNSVELHPQITGYAELDKLLEEILSPYEGSDNFTKLKAAYDWTVREIDYSWAPYSQSWAPAYDCFVPQYELSYDEGLQEAIPYEIANRSYHAIKYKEGICYDYAAVFAVMSRYIGIDAFVHTGTFIFEASLGSGSGHHGWTELYIDGKYYIFDPQRDYRMSGNGEGKIPYLYFGIPYENAWRYTQETDANEARDSGFLPVAEERSYVPVIRAQATASGTATGSGSYPVGSSVTVSAQGDGFVGWYDESGTRVSTEAVYTFTVLRSMTLLAVFEGELFSDIPSDAWYRADANEAGVLCIVSGTDPFIFDASLTLTRAMAVTLIARASAEEITSGSIVFEDVPADTWFTNTVAWAHEKGIVKGISPQEFDPHAPVTREQFITMLLRFALYAGLVPENQALSYTDVGDISPFALSSMEQAQALGLLTGYPDGSIRPQNLLTRAEGVTLLMRLLRQIEEK